MDNIDNKNEANTVLSSRTNKVNLPDINIFSKIIIITSSIIMTYILYQGEYHEYDLSTFGRILMCLFGFVGGLIGGVIGDWLGKNSPFIFNWIAKKINMEDSTIFWLLVPLVLGVFFGAVILAIPIALMYKL